MTYTVTWTFGTPARWARGSIACLTLADAARNAKHCADFQYTSPLMALEIRSGDFAPRLSNGAWTAAPDTGWED